MTELVFDPSIQKADALAASDPKIGLLDHMGFGNMGDAAILESFISNIRKRIPRATLVAFSLNPADTEGRHNVLTYPIRACHSTRKDANVLSTQTLRLNLKSRLKGFIQHFPTLHKTLRNLVFPVREVAHLARSYRIVRSLDSLVLSGGGQLCELWKELPYNVFKFCILAKFANIPVYIVGVGAGPLTRPWNKAFAKWSVQLSQYTSFRDIESKNLLHDLGVNGETHLCPDPAYALDCRDYVKNVPARSARSIVGLNPMGFCDPRIWPQRDQAVYSAYLDKLASFVVWLLANGYDIEVFTSDIVVDRYAIEDLERRLAPICDQNPRVVFRPLLTLEELLNQISRFEFVVTSKYHGIIFSHLLEKPVIGLSYHPKIEALMRTVGHPEYCLGIDSFKLTSLIEVFLSLVRNGEDLRSRFRRTTVTYACELRAHFDYVLGILETQRRAGICRRAEPPRTM